MVHYFFQTDSYRIEKLKFCEKCLFTVRPERVEGSRNQKLKMSVQERNIGQLMLNDAVSCLILFKFKLSRSFDRLRTNGVRNHNLLPL